MRPLPIHLDELIAHDAWLRAVARSLLRDPNAVDDVVQETYLAAHEHVSAGGAGSRPWLRRVILNFARLRNRSEGNRRRRERAVARGHAVPSVAEMVGREETRRRVSRAVLALEEPYRSAILYRYFEGLPPRAIARESGVSREAIEGRLKRAIRMLRARLEAEFGDRDSLRGALGAIAPALGSTGTAATASPVIGAAIMASKIKAGLVAIAGAILVVVAAAWLAWPSAPEAPEPTTTPPPVSRAEPTPPAGRPDEEPREASDAPSRPATSAPAVEIALAPEAGSVRGVVTDRDGAPLVGARIAALRFSAGAIDLEAIATTRTDHKGRYVIDVDRPCVVEASSDGWATERRLVVPFSREDFVLASPGIVRGRVLAATDGEPVAGVPVAIYRWGPGDSAENTTWRYAWHRPPLATRRTDASGVFAFRVAPGSYRLRALPTQAPQAHSRGGPIHVAADGEQVHDLLLPAGLALTGIVYDAETKRPVPGATVWVDPGRRHIVTADADGRYRLPGIERDAAWLGASAPGYWPVASGGWNLTADETSRDLRLFPCGRIRGRVVGPDGPVAGARVSASRLLLEVPEARAFSIDPWSAVTDADGAFEVPSRAGAARFVHASAPGLAPGTSADAVAVERGEVRDGVVVRLTPGARVVGRVRDARGGSVAGARVVLVRGRTTQWHAATSRADGRYAIPHVREGSYTVEVLAPTGGRIGDPVLADWRGTIEVPATGDAPLDVVLGDGASLAGRVVDEDGRPIEGVRVRAQRRKPGLPGMLLPRPPGNRVAMTDTAGRFRVDGLLSRDQRYQLDVRKLGYTHALIERASADAPLADITLYRHRVATGQVVDANGEPVHEFRLGMMRDRVDGEPPVLAQGGRYIEGSSKTIRGSRYLDLDGRFEVFAQPGRYRITAFTPDDRRSERAELVVPAVGEPAPMRLVVHPAGAVDGVVTTPASTPAPDFSVRAYATDGTRRSSLQATRSDRTGRFSLRSLPPRGRLVILAYGWVGDDAVCAMEPADVAVGVACRLALQTTVVPETRIRVANADGPLPGARVVVSRVDGIPFEYEPSRDRLMREVRKRDREAGKRFPDARARARAQLRERKRLKVTAADGSVYPLLLIPGRYRVRVTAPGHAPHEETVDVAGSQHTLTVRLVAE